MNTTTALRPAPTAPNSIAAKPLRQVGNVRELLVNDMAKGQLAAVAASHMKPERMMRLIANAIRVTPKLADCEPMSLLGALMQCASLGLEPNTVLGHAYLIPFDKKQKNRETGRWETVGTNVQLIVGYKGLIDLARRSGHITSISANIHYSDDDLWEYEEGTEATLRHRPGNLEGQKLHAYAIAKFRDGGHAYVVLPWAHVMRIRDNSEGWKTAVRMGGTDKSPWKAHEDEMAKKTAIRALAKYLPLSVEFQDAVQLDGARADYGAFALNPTHGMAEIEAVSQNGDEDGVPYAGEQVDAETGEVTRIEDRRGTEQTIEQQREPERAETPREEPAKRQTRTAKPKQEEAPALALEGETAHAADPEIGALVERVREWALNDMHDGASAESTIAAYENQLGIIKKSDAKAHDALVAEIRAAKQQG
ncbi:recombinase RecT [Paracoccus sp. 22332]|uniref:recombinase RecT n=1 Tax=Paracoccus sp. 22332 TaxID=3453913 RepID=UPI003F831537